jgi:hypothetical protein
VCLCVGWNRRREKERSELIKNHEPNINGGKVEEGKMKNNQPKQKESLFSHVDLVSDHQWIILLQPIHLLLSTD